MNPFVIIISGATATGKSDLAIKLAETINGEVINADIGSFYKPLTIGTAKPDWQQEKVPHHLFDIIDKPESYTIVQFREQVVQFCNEMWQRGVTPIIVGGSTMYIQSLFYRQHEIPEIAHQFVIELESSKESTTLLWNQLQKIDDERAKKIDPQDRYRIIRALAIYKATGIKPSEFQPIWDPVAPFNFITCERNRQELYDRINTRVDIMVRNGWLDEVNPLVGTEWESFLYRKKVIGYDDLLRYLVQDGTYKTLDETIQSIQKKTRNYAKRQITFLGKLHREVKESVLRIKDQKESPFVGTNEHIDLTLCDVGLYIKQLSEQIMSKVSS